MNFGLCANMAEPVKYLNHWLQHEIHYGTLIVPIFLHWDMLNLIQLLNLKIIYINYLPITIQCNCTRANTHIHVQCDILDLSSVIISNSYTPDKVIKCCRHTSECVSFNKQLHIQLPLL